MSTKPMKPMKPIKHKQTEVQYGGVLGNYILKIDREVGCCLNQKQSEKLQNEIHLWCDMGSEYLNDKILEDIHFQSLDIDLEKFISDPFYYYQIFDNKRDVYDTLIGWFSGEMIKIFNDIRKLLLSGEGFSEELNEIHDYIYNKHFDVHQFDGRTDDYNDYIVWLKNYYSEISVKHSLNKKNRYGWNGDLLEREGRVV